MKAPLACHGRHLELAQVPAGGAATARLATTTLGLAILGRCVDLIRLAHRLLSVRVDGWVHDTNGHCTSLYDEGRRSEERRVGKECRGRRWWSREKKKAGTCKCSVPH